MRHNRTFHARLLSDCAFSAKIGVFKHFLSKKLDYLEKAFSEKNALMVFLKVDPKWNNLRGDAHFVDLMRQMNFEQSYYQREFHKETRK